MAEPGRYTHTFVPDGGATRYTVRDEATGDVLEARTIPAVVPFGADGPATLANYRQALHGDPAALAEERRQRLRAERRARRERRLAASAAGGARSVA